jgi:hypothetical protein
MKTLTIASLLILTLTVGCVQVPMTTISVPLSGGRTVTVKAPKDSEIDGLEVDFVTGKLSLAKYRARMNPEVISASAAGQVALIQGYTELTAVVGQLAIKGFSAGQAGSVGTNAIPQ